MRDGYVGCAPEEGTAARADGVEDTLAARANHRRPPHLASISRGSQLREGAGARRSLTTEVEAATTPVLRAERTRGREMLTRWSHSSAVMKL